MSVALTALFQLRGLREADAGQSHFSPRQRPQCGLLFWPLFLERNLKCLMLSLITSHSSKGMNKLEVKNCVVYMFFLLESRYLFSWSM